MLGSKKEDESKEISCYLKGYFLTVQSKGSQCRRKEKGIKNVLSGKLKLDSIYVSKKMQMQNTKEKGKSHTHTQSFQFLGILISI